MHHMVLTPRLIVHKIIFIKIFVFELLSVSIPLDVGWTSYFLGVSPSTDARNH